MSHYKFSRRHYDVASLNLLLKEAKAAIRLDALTSARWATSQARRIIRTSNLQEAELKSFLAQLAMLEAAIHNDTF